MLIKKERRIGKRIVNNMDRKKYCEVDLMSEDDKCFCETIAIALFIIFILGLAYIIFRMILWLW